MDPARIVPDDQIWDAIKQECADAAANEPLLLVAIPYHFARTFGTVLVDAADGRISVALREGADPRALLEVRRVLGRPFDVAIVEAAAFDQLLSDRYSRQRTRFAGERPADRR